MIVIPIERMILLNRATFVKNNYYFYLLGINVINDSSDINAGRKRQNFSGDPIPPQRPPYQPLFPRAPIFRFVLVSLVKIILEIVEIGNQTVRTWQTLRNGFIRQITSENTPEKDKKRKIKNIFCVTLLQTRGTGRDERRRAFKP